MHPPLAYAPEHASSLLLDASRTLGPLRLVNAGVVVTLVSPQDVPHRQWVPVVG